MLLSQNIESSESCYDECYIRCAGSNALKIPKILPCAMKCLKECIFDSATPDGAYYCKLDCAADTCAAEIYEGIFISIYYYFHLIKRILT